MAQHITSANPRDTLPRPRLGPLQLAEQLLDSRQVGCGESGGVKVKVLLVYQHGRARDRELRPLFSHVQEQWAIGRDRGVPPDKLLVRVLEVEHRALGSLAHHIAGRTGENAVQQRTRLGVELQREGFKNAGRSERAGVARAANGADEPHHDTAGRQRVGAG